MIGNIYNSEHFHKGLVRDVSGEKKGMIMIHFNIEVTQKIIINFARSTAGTYL